MDALAFLIDFILHVDVHLKAFVLDYGAWVYALLFLIIFTETGVVVMPFLPGDSLLFVVGTLCGAGLMSLPLAMTLLTLQHRPLRWAQGVAVGAQPLLQQARLRAGARLL
jgi:membrane-associated protein